MKEKARHGSRFALDSCTARLMRNQNSEASAAPGSLSSEMLGSRRCLDSFASGSATLDKQACQPARSVLSHS